MKLIGAGEWNDVKLRTTSSSSSELYTLVLLFLRLGTMIGVGGPLLVLEDDLEWENEIARNDDVLPCYRMSRSCGVPANKLSRRTRGGKDVRTLPAAAPAFDCLEELMSTLRIR